MTTILALDFGGSKHTVGIYQPTPGVHPSAWADHRLQTSPPSASAKVDLEIILNLADEVLKGQPPDAVGVSFGGPVDADAKLVLLSHHIPGWENFPLGALLQARYNCPVMIDNDANAAALGEHHYGAGQGCNTLMYITVSTGVGGGWIFDDRIWHGANSMAGEIGHIVVDPLGPLCLCGKRGCVERMASGPFLAQDARQRLTENPNLDSTLRSLSNGNLANITSVMISQAAAQGDPLAGDLLQRGARALGIGIGNAANLVNPQRFILGGGVTKSGDIFWQTMRKAARETALPQIKFEILPAALGDDAPLWGAVALVEPCLGLN